MSFYRKEFLMKKFFLALISLILLSGMITPACAQFYMSSMSDARALSADGIKLGGGVSVFDNVLGLGGNIRIGILDGLEFSGKLGFVNYEGNQGGDDHTGMSFGAELKYQLLEVDFGDPVDLSLGGGVEYYDVGEDASLWMFGGNAIVSYPIEFESGQVLSPLFRLNMRVDRSSWSANGDDKSDSDFEFGFGFGADFALSQYFGFFGEFVIGGGDIDAGFVGGVWFGL
jgi:hypothetical protein